VVQSLILDKMRGTIRGKLEREHGVRQERREGFIDDWAAVAAEVEGTSSTTLQRGTAPQSQTPNNLRLGPLPESQNSSHTAEASLNFGAGSAVGLPRYLDSDPLSPHPLPEETVGLTLDPQ